ncbi:E3 ubiquitin-protein ligase ATL41-like [Panicum miliaceum]|uniref:E3 ubiquitin-protein ligase ATL41-like n=1 Tax=Panicum miliaceum TaxID=4540 RepID=A0A3L6SWZ8_PANMI|nr:E3 ubiquitin-protein ligase ATL41-like [Panicum miliaceum]
MNARNLSLLGCKYIAWSSLASSPDRRHVCVIEAGDRTACAGHVVVVACSLRRQRPLLTAVAALSAAVAFVAALHLYSRCLLQRRAALAEGNPRVLVLRRPPSDGYELEVASAGA